MCVPLVCRLAPFHQDSLAHMFGLLVCFISFDSAVFFAPKSYLVVLQIMQFIQEEKDNSTRCSDTELRWRIAEHLCDVGFNAVVKQAVGGGPEGCCFDRLNHAFIEIQLEGEQDDRISLIVELTFREMFVVHPVTPRYTEILKEVPEVFVGPKDQLFELLRLLCKEMESVFTSYRRAIPPWRKFKSVASRWDPIFFCELTGPRTLGPKVGSNELKLNSSELGWFGAAGALPLPVLNGLAPNMDESKPSNGVHNACPTWAKDNKLLPDAGKIIVVKTVG